ncbi:unnamed protein product, partial [Ixodes pacificus]
CITTFLLIKVFRYIPHLRSDLCFSMLGYSLRTELVERSDLRVLGQRVTKRAVSMPSGMTEIS